jgi:phenylacetate-coenzyme A ligase PaaK-like adenylate-forming protein
MNRPPEFIPEYHTKSRAVLETALGQLSAYRSWRAYDPGADQPVDERYAALPALTKRDIREHFPRGFVPADRDIKKGLKSGEIQLVSTSGTSDAVRVTNIWNQAWWDASERASWKLNAHAALLATGDHPEAILANARNVGFISDESDLPFDKRRLARFLYLNEKTNPAAWSAELMDRMIDEMAIFRPDILEANPSLLARLSRYAAARGKEVFQPGLIVFTFEYPSVLHYRQIGRVFKSPTASSYGTTETGYVFMECEAGKLHQNSEFCRVDFQPFKPEHGGRLAGRIMVTTFNNPWYYMLRFDVGDLVRLDETQECACGRDSGFIAPAIEGRFINATLTCEGCLVTLRTLDNALGALEGLDEYRLEQGSPGAYVLYLASQRRDRKNLDDEAVEILRRIYGKKADIAIVHEEFLVPEDSGKYSLARALFPLDIRDYLDADRAIV